MFWLVTVHTPLAGVRIVEPSSSVYAPVPMTAPMVGGSGSTIVQQYVRTRGKDARENTTQIEGLDVGWIRGTQDRGYDNFAMAQEVAVETNAAGADVAGGGVRINLVPREGSNTYSADVVFSGMTETRAAPLAASSAMRDSGLVAASSMRL